MLIPRLRANFFGSLWSTHNLLQFAVLLWIQLFYFWDQEIQPQHFSGKLTMFADDRKKGGGGGGIASVS